MKIENPPAFPSEQHETADGTRNQTYCDGMSLRDWFAGQALAGSCSNTSMWDGSGSAATLNTGREWMARETYAFADAMLAERSKVQP